MTTSKPLRVFLVFASLLLGVPPCLVAASDQQLTIERLDLRELPEVDCYFTVRDERGDYLLGLRDSDAAVLVDGLSQPDVLLASALAEDEALAVALLFDRSGSVRSSLARVKEAAVDFVGRMSVGDSVAVISFDDEVRRESELTMDRRATEDAIEAVELGRNTALYDALHEALEVLSGVSTRRAIVVFSDGRDTRSRSSRGKVEAALRDSGVPVFTVGLAATLDEDTLLRLASLSRGRFLSAAGPGDLTRLYRELAEQLKNEYQVTFRLEAGEDGQWHDLEIVVHDQTGAEARGRTEFLASTGPGVGRERLSDFEGQIRRRRIGAVTAVGTTFGLGFAMLLLVTVKFLRPEKALLSWPGLGILVSSAVLGGIIAVLMTSTP